MIESLWFVAELNVTYYAKPALVKALLIRFLFRYPINITSNIAIRNDPEQINFKLRQ
jgi:hypothetical protein